MLTTTSLPSMASNKEKEVINQNLGTKDTSTPPNSTMNQDSCSICLTDTIEQRGELPCKHAFCYDCIEGWSKQENTCPLCKKRFTNIRRYYTGTELEAAREEAERVAAAAAQISGRKRRRSPAPRLFQRVNVARRDQRNAPSQLPVHPHTFAVRALIMGLIGQPHDDAVTATRQVPRERMDRHRRQRRATYEEEVRRAFANRFGRAHGVRAIPNRDPIVIDLSNDDGASSNRNPAATIGNDSNGAGSNSRNNNMNMGLVMQEQDHSDAWIRDFHGVGTDDLVGAQFENIFDQDIIDLIDAEHVNVREPSFLTTENSTSSNLTAAAAALIDLSGSNNSPRRRDSRMSAASSSSSSSNNSHVEIIDLTDD